MNKYGKLTCPGCHFYGELNDVIEDEPRKLRRLLIQREAGKCIYCGCEVVTEKPNKGERFNDRMATVEHIFSKNDIRRFLIHNLHNTVLACYACNHKRGQEELTALQADFANLPKVNLIEILTNQQSNQST